VIGGEGGTEEWGLLAKISIEGWKIYQGQETLPDTTLKDTAEATCGIYGDKKQEISTSSDG